MNIPGATVSVTLSNFVASLNKESKQTMAEKYITSGARISSDNIYRYLLWRQWGANSDSESCLFVMLNPSTANANLDDPTIRRCVGFAKYHGYEHLVVANLFAYRATKPSDLFNCTAIGVDPVGWQNQKFLAESARRAGLIICAWGAHGGFMGQEETVRGWLQDTGKPLYALGLTKGGHPRHPLYIPASTQLIRYGHN